MVLLLLQAAFLVFLLLNRPARHVPPRPPVVQPPPEHSAADYSEASVMRDQCRKIISALRDFRLHRGGYPVPAAPGDEKKAFRMDPAMLAAVSGEDAALNPARVNYFKPWNLASRTLDDLRKGFFYAAFDFDGDARVPDPSGQGGMIDQDVLVWHAGKDGDPGTWNDNFRAWLDKK